MKSHLTVCVLDCLYIAGCWIRIKIILKLNKIIEHTHFKRIDKVVLFIFNEVILGDNELPVCSSNSFRTPDSSDAQLCDLDVVCVYRSVHLLEMILLNLMYNIQRHVQPYWNPNRDPIAFCCGTPCNATVPVASPLHPSIALHYKALEVVQCTESWMERYFSSIHFTEPSPTLHMQSLSAALTSLQREQRGWSESETGPHR